MSTLENEVLSREISLEIDSSRGQLGAAPSREVGQDARRAAEHEFRKWGVKADVTTVQQGRLRDKDACLIVFEFRFLYDIARSSGRLSDAKITLTLEPMANSGVYPDVKIYSPRLLEGPVHVGNHARETWSASFSAGGIIPFSPTIGIAKTVGGEYLIDQRFYITGKKWAKPRGMKPYNQALWELQENSSQGDGIPMIFKAAIVIHEVDQPIHATVKISATTKAKMPLFGWPWSTSTPLLFKPGLVVGQQLDVSDFGQLGDANWNQLCNIPEVITACRWTEASGLITQETANAAAQPASDQEP